MQIWQRRKEGLVWGKKKVTLPLNIKKDLILLSLALSDHVRCTLADRERNYNRWNLSGDENKFVWIVGLSYCELQIQSSRHWFRSRESHLMWECVCKGKLSHFAANVVCGSKNYKIYFSFFYASC